jgi:NADH-quinone oxidoreductase subunit N
MVADNTVSVILPGIVVAGAALLVVAADLVLAQKRVLAWIAAGGLVAGAAVALAQWLTSDGNGVHLDRTHAHGGFAGMVAMDKYGLYCILLFAAVGVLTVMVADGYLERRHASRGEFYGLLLLIITGMIGMAVSTDVIAFFVSFELMSLPTYVLAGFIWRDARSGEASMKYFINGAFASAILAFGLALLYAATGQTNYALISRALATLPADARAMLVVAFVLIVTGFGFKVSAVPFHSWAPDVYEGAPTPVTAFMSVGVKAGAFAGFVRLFTVAAGIQWRTWTDALIILAVLTMIVGNVLALPQRNLKRMLAYSSIAHAGYLTLGLIAAGKSGDSAGSSAILFYLAGYALMNLGAFGILVWIRNHRRFGYTLEEVGGLSRTMPGTSLLLALFMISLTGIPPTVGFWAKFYLFTAVLNAHLLWLAVVAVLMSTVSAYYYLRVVWYLYFREAPEGAEVQAEPHMPQVGIGLALGVVAAGVLVVGLYPQPLLQAAQGAMHVVLGV